MIDMIDYGFASFGNSVDLHNVKPISTRPMPRTTIRLKRPPQAHFLALVDAPHTPRVRAHRSMLLDLHENERLRILFHGDDIDLKSKIVFYGADISLDDPETFSAQILDDNVLAPLAVLFRNRHFTSPFRSSSFFTRGITTGSPKQITPIEVEIASHKPIASAELITK